MADRDMAYEILARMGKALASPARLKIIHLLAQCERSVEDLSVAAEEPLARVSHHLQRLKAAKLVQSRKDGRRVIYDLAGREVALFWSSYRRFVEGQLAELQLLALDAGAQDVEKIDSEALQRLRKRGGLLLLDVRPAEEYQAAHLPGAVSIPVEELEQRIKEIPRNKKLVVCCRGPYCRLAEQALPKLRTRGLDATRLLDGVPEWEAAGIPIRRGG